MTPNVVIVMKPDVDFATFLGVSDKVLGYSPASKVDQSRLEHSDTERFISCLAAFRDEDAPAGLTPNLFHHVSFSVFIVADERDLLDIIQAASGMPVVISETLARGVLAAIITGTLSQWRDAVKSGANPHVEHNVRACYCQIMSLFEQAGLNGVWSDYQAKPMSDRTFYLEDRR